MTMKINILILIIFPPTESVFNLQTTYVMMLYPAVTGYCCYTVADLKPRTNVLCVISVSYFNTSITRNSQNASWYHATSCLCPKPSHFPRAQDRENASQPSLTSSFTPPPFSPISWPVLQSWNFLFKSLPSYY